MADFFRYYKKFLSRWTTELLSFGREQMVGVILAVLILVFQLRYGLIQTKDVRANALATILWPYFALIGVYLVVHLVRTPWKLDQELTDKLAKQATDEEIKHQIRLLTALIDRGQEFSQKCRSQKDLVPYESVNAWAKEAAESVEKVFDNTYISRFESGVGIPMGGAYWPNLENRHVDGFVLVRLYRLQEFVNELRERLRTMPPS